MEQRPLNSRYHTRPTASLPTCLDLARNQRIRQKDPNEHRQIEEHIHVSAFAKTAGPKLDGCPYCALILFAVYSQADYLIRENANLRVFFPLYGGIIREVFPPIFPKIGEVQPKPRFQPKLDFIMRVELHQKSRISQHSTPSKLNSKSTKI